MAITEDKSILIDTNILVYANAKGYVLREEAIEKLRYYEREGFALWISRQIIREFLSTMSNLMRVNNSYDETVLLQFVSHLHRQFIIADETEVTTKYLLDLVASHRVIGKQIHDCNLVATMKQYDITQILTHNVSDFHRYLSENIKVIALT